MAQAVDMDNYLIEPATIIKDKQIAVLRKYGWSGAIAEFINLSEEAFLSSLIDYHKVSLNESPSISQEVAWKNTYKVLLSELYSLVQQYEKVKECGIIFEYELPRERGRRPDVIILLNDSIIVFEFKDYKVPLLAHIDQLTAYVRDLGNYHAGSHNKKILPILLTTIGTGVLHQHENIWISTPDQLNALLKQAIMESTQDKNANISEWINSDYAPLPSLVTAARLIFDNEPLPQIKMADRAGIRETVAELIRISELAKRNNEQHLALVTGVPGSGKTLVGLQFVYSKHFDDKSGGRAAVFLSGNGPLVQVLQYALKSGIFVQDVHGFLKEYGGKSNRIPEEHIWVYDEAQRAWDSERVKEKRGHDASEPEDFLRIGERLGSWAMMVGLIGEGQEIHLGEEAGLIQWNDAIGKMDKEWIVHCPSHVKDLFTNAKAVEVNENLNLTVSLRSHLAEDVQTWVSLLLDGQIELAAEIAMKVHQQNFEMYVTQDLEAAKEYVQERYKGQLDKRYGILASSKASNLPEYGIHNEFQFTNRTRAGPWYYDAPDSKYSCCQLRDVVTEFSCQGLELDFPIIAWGEDLIWKNNSFNSKPQKRSKARDPNQLRINSYRVLLTRGRDGFIIFIPKETAMQPTFNTLVWAGIKELKLSH